MTTANQLQKAEARYRADFARAEKSREARNRLVLEARAAGWTDQRIGEAMGLTRGRINQIREPPMVDVFYADPVDEDGNAIGTASLTNVRGPWGPITPVKVPASGIVRDPENMEGEQ